MSKFFLISANINTEPYPVYPLGMAVIAKVLSAAGHRVRQYDYLAEGVSDCGLKQALSEFVPDFVGISLRNIDNVDSFSDIQGWYLEEIRVLIEIVRQKTAAPVILGGSGFSILPEEILDYLAADYGVVGEGERTICDLIEKLEEGRSVSRISKNHGHLLNGKDMVSPRWEKDLINFYIERSGMVNLQTKRGCPFHCHYCSYPILEGSRLRIKEPEMVVDEIKKLKEEFGVDTIFITDSIFNDPFGHYLILAEEIVKHKLKIRWYGFFRPQGIGSKELNLLKRSGLCAMEVGTDAACDSTLTAINKQFAFEDVIKFNQACIKEKIPVAHYIMFGGPDETMKTVIEGLKNLQKLENCVVFAFCGIRIHPNTRIYTRALQEGVLDPEDSLLKPVYYFSPKLDRGAMNDCIAENFKGRRDRIFPPSEALLRMAAMNRFGYRGLLWDRLISFKKNSKPDRDERIKF
jgi:lipid biosynthesis B12-binding/radical SAM protein